MAAGSVSCLQCGQMHVPWCDLAQAVQHKPTECVHVTLMQQAVLGGPSGAAAL